MSLGQRGTGSPMPKGPFPKDAGSGERRGAGRSEPPARPKRGDPRRGPAPPGPPCPGASRRRGEGSASPGTGTGLGLGPGPGPGRGRGPGPAQRSPAGGTRGAPAPAAANSASAPRPPAPCPPIPRLPHAPPAGKGGSGGRSPGRGVWRRDPRGPCSAPNCSGSSGITVHFISSSSSLQLYFGCALSRTPRVSAAVPAYGL